MKYLVKDGFALGGAIGDVYPGDTAELTPAEAAPYVAAGRLVPMPEAAPPASGGGDDGTKDPEPPAGDASSSAPTVGDPAARTQTPKGRTR
jgi:hypothetical protein